MTSIVLEVTVAGLVVTRLLSNDMGNKQASLEALEIAKSGAEDAIIRVNRYIHCPDSIYCPAVYSMTIDSSEVCINIEETVVDQEIRIYSRGVVQGKRRFVEALLDVIPSDASVYIKMFKEIEDPGTEFDDNGC